MTAETTAIKLLLADVDGTLVTKDKILTERAIQAVKSLRDAGILFAVTSGRPPKGMEMLIAPLQITTPIAGYNGGAFTQPDLSIIEAQTIPNDAPKPIIAVMEKYNLDVWLYRGTDWYVRKQPAPHIEREAFTVKYEPILVPNYDGMLDDAVKIVGVSDDLEAVAKCETELQKDFGARVSATRSQPYYLDVTNHEANKGEVVAWLAKRFRLSPQAIATIGDMPNDTLMFAPSGLSIAMGNASPEVQAKAQRVTTSNEDEGFANAIERFILPQTE